MAVTKKLATVVSIDYRLETVSIGEKIQFQHDPTNAYDNMAINAYLSTTKEQIGYMAASPHTTLAGCEMNKQMVQYIPSPDIPLIGTVIQKKEVSLRNGTFSTVLKVEIYVVIKDKAV